jgi:uncharacterized repeat protein (TIGR03803 family)
MTITRSMPLYVAVLTLALAGCSSRGSGTTTPSNSGASSSVAIGGTLSGLASGESVVLEMNGGDPQTVSAGGKFTFPAIALNASYSVTVATAPAGQTCTVTGGTGTATSANIAAIAVTCLDQTYTLGGSVSGLTTSGLVLANGTDRLTVAANASSFTMHTSVAYTSPYVLKVQTQPASATCMVVNGSNTMGAKPVTNIAVTCALVTFTVGGTISGLGNTRGLVLANGSDRFTVPPNATSFTMPTGVAVGSTYNITIHTHPPLESCSVTNGAGPMAAAAITNVAVVCTPGMQESVLYSFNTTGDGTYPYYTHLLLASDGNFYGTGGNGGANGLGAVFKITPAGVETVLWSFGVGTDGTKPFGGLVQGTDGALYGMTFRGGTNDNGAVFKITLAGVETVLWSFGSGTDGTYPYGSLIQSTDGNYYGMTEGGGANNDGIVFKLTPAGAETILWSFGSGTDGNTPYGSLLQASDGNFYGMTEGGGTNTDGTVFKITPAGAETVLWSFGSGTDGQEPYGSLIQASDGNFYGLTNEGGANSYGAVFKITLAGVETVLWSFGSGTDGTYPYGSLVQGSDGNFYGMTCAGGANNYGAIFQITPSGTETLLWSLGAGTDGSYPYGDFTLGPDGTLYGVTYDGGAYNQGAVIEFN